MEVKEEGPLEDVTVKMNAEQDNVTEGKANDETDEEKADFERSSRGSDQEHDSHDEKRLEAPLTLPWQPENTTHTTKNAFKL